MKKINLGLKIGSKDIQFTDEILKYYDQGIFQYIELFTLSETYNDTISYWKQFKVPFGIHAPHSAAGLNLVDASNRKSNKNKITEVIKFANELKASYIIFHSGTDGIKEEVVYQLKPFADERFLIENKPIRGVTCGTSVGCTYEELKFIIDEIGSGCGFCLDFGHAICAANTLKRYPYEFINELKKLSPKIFHLTDGNYNSEKDSHFHYGSGTFPLKQLLDFTYDECMITNEAKRINTDSLVEFYQDAKYLRNIVM